MGEVMGGPHKEGALSLSAPREDRARARPSANGKSQELTGLASRARVSSPECETSARGLRGFTAAPVPEQAVGPALLSGLTRGVGTRPGRRRMSGQSHRQFLAPRAGPRAIAAALGPAAGQEQWLLQRWRPGLAVEEPALTGRGGLWGRYTCQKLLSGRRAV